MTGYYDIIKILKESLEANPNVTSVTEGSIFNVDINKRTLFPLSHVMINSVNHEGNTLRFNVSILHMDIENQTSNKTTDDFKGNSDEHDILNTQLAVAVKTIEDFYRGDNYGGTFQLEGQPDIQPWTDRFENYLAGWTSTFDVIYANSMTIC
tara:strand:- start:582 stop:1037 length:456 start_codon:yes stop_codon:yes gene_type:complete